MSPAINRRELSLTIVTPLLYYDDHQLATIGRLALQIGVADFEWSEVDVAANPFLLPPCICESRFPPIVATVGMQVK